MVWSLTSGDPTPARAVVRISLYLLAFSFAVHIFELKVAPELGFRANTWPGEIKCLVKHSAELSGWILLATGVPAGCFLRVNASPRSSRGRRSRGGRANLALRIAVRPLPAKWTVGIAVQLHNLGAGMDAHGRGSSRALGARREPSSSGAITKGSA